MRQTRKREEGKRSANSNAVSGLCLQMHSLTRTSGDGKDANGWQGTDVWVERKKMKKCANDDDDFGGNS